MFYCDSVAQLGENTAPKILKMESFLPWQELAMARMIPSSESGEQIGTAWNGLSRAIENEAIPCLINSGVLNPCRQGRIWILC